MTLVAVKGGSARLSHRRRKHRWQLRGAKQLSELRSAKAPVAAETARDPMANGAAGGEEGPPQPPSAKATLAAEGGKGV